MRDLLILGNGVHACEMVEIIERYNQKNEYRFLGFVARKPDDKGLLGYPVFGLEDLDGPLRHALLIPDNTFELEVKQRFSDRVITLIDPSCFVSRTARIGRGTVLFPHCYVGLNAVVGDFVFCLSGCIINHDVIIEEGSILASGVSLAGHVNIKREVYLGQASTVKQYLSVGEKSLVGMGAVVVRDVEPNTVVVGNPAIILKKLEDLGH